MAVRHRWFIGGIKKLLRYKQHTNANTYNSHGSACPFIMPLLPRTLVNEVVMNQTAGNNIAWRLTGTRVLVNTSTSPVTATVNYYSPTNASITNASIAAAGMCGARGSDTCNCTFDDPVACPPQALAPGVGVSCTLTCSDGTSNVTASAAFNGFSVTAGAVNVVLTSNDDATACVDVIAPLLTVRATPGPWLPAVMHCGSFVDNVWTTTPPPGAAECAMFNESYLVESSVEVQVAGASVAAPNATATIGCPQATVTTTVGFNRTKHWEW